MSDCVFCKIIKKEIPSTIVDEDEEMIAFKDIYPLAPVHILIVPKVHFSSLVEAKNEQQDLLGKLLLKTRDIAVSQGIDKTGYKVFINNGEGAGQDVFHLHLHLTGNWKKGV